MGALWFLFSSSGPAVGLVPDWPAIAAGVLTAAAAGYAGHKQQRTRK